MGHRFALAKLLKVLYLGKVAPNLSPDEGMRSAGPHLIYSSVDN